MRVVGGRRRRGGVRRHGGGRKGGVDDDDEDDDERGEGEGEGGPMDEQKLFSTFLPEHLKDETPASNLEGSNVRVGLNNVEMPEAPRIVERCAFWGCRSLRNVALSRDTVVEYTT